MYMHPSLKPGEHVVTTADIDSNSVIMHVEHRRPNEPTNLTASIKLSAEQADALATSLRLCATQLRHRRTQLFNAWHQ